jgi:hypothetical protein
LAYRDTGNKEVITGIGIITKENLHKNQSTHKQDG